MTWTQRAVYAERMRRGIVLLDAACPDWAGRVDVTQLDMHSQTDDLLGQLYGDYSTGFAAVLAGQPSDVLFVASECGFGLPLYEQMADEDVVRMRFAILTEVWRDEIAARITNSHTTRPTP